MYETHFGLNELPFSIAPDPAFLFLSDAHNEALAHLMYGFSHGGFVMITGEVGTGKTTLLRNLINRTPPELEVAFILNPRLTARELLETLCDELGVSYPENADLSIKQLIDLLNKHLLQTYQEDRSTVVVIDEAQNLSPAVLEQIRLLTNLETDSKKLLRIILLGQPELAEMLDRPELRQLAQRITARFHLESLGKRETHDYVQHRLIKAGGRPGAFSPSALSTLYRFSGGTPRLINVIADRAMLGAYVEGKYEVTPSMVRRAAHEVFGDRTGLQKWFNLSLYYKVAPWVVVVVASAMLWTYLSQLPPQDDLPAINSAIGSPGAASDLTVEEPNVSERTAMSYAQKDRAKTPQQAIDRNMQRPVEPPPPVVSFEQSTQRSETGAVINGDLTQQPQPNPIESASARTLSATLTRAQPAPINSPTDGGPDILKRPAGETFLNKRLAYQAVFGEWGVAYPVNSPLIPCDFAPGEDLQCLARSGGLSEINFFDVPVVLKLRDEQSTPYFAAILGIDRDQRYKIFNAGQTANVTAQNLAQYWAGEFAVLWRTPPQYHGNMRRGDDHPTVRWLRQSLVDINPALSLDTTSTIFDGALRQALITFQKSEEIIADGVAGPLTWIRMRQRLKLPAPKLTP